MKRIDSSCAGLDIYAKLIKESDTARQPNGFEGDELHESWKFWAGCLVLAIIKSIALFYYLGV